jgi:hypothetical protein
MTSKRSPRRDPRTEDGHAPIADDLGLKRPRTLPPETDPPRRVPRAEGGSMPPADEVGFKRARPATMAPTSSGSDTDLETLRSRYAEAEAKRRRAESIQESLTQRLAQLEAEQRSRSATQDDAHRRLEARAAELEVELRESRAELVTARQRLAASEAANTELDHKLSVERGRADAAERELVRAERSASSETSARLSSMEARASAASVTATSLEAELAHVRRSHAHLEQRLRSLETEKGEQAAALVAAREMLESAEARLAEADRAQPRPASASEPEARRARDSATAAAREAIARLERHEAKLSALRKAALSRALWLLDGGAPDAAGRSVSSSELASARSRVRSTVQFGSNPGEGLVLMSPAAVARSVTPRRTIQGLSVAVPDEARSGGAEPSSDEPVVEITIDDEP